MLVNQAFALINLISRNGIRGKEGGYDSSTLLAFRELVNERDEVWNSDEDRLRRKNTLN